MSQHEEDLSQNPKHKSQNAEIISEDEEKG